MLYNKVIFLCCGKTADILSRFKKKVKYLKYFFVLKTNELFKMGKYQFARFLQFWILEKINLWLIV